MDSFKHCIYYYNAFIQFVWTNAKRFYQMRFLSIRKDVCCLFNNKLFVIVLNLI